MIATIITALYLLGIITAPSATTFLYIIGALLILAELTTLTTFGILAFNGLLSLIVGYMIDNQTNTIMGLDIDWSFFFGIGAAEVVILAACVFVVLRYRGKRITTGTESMLGDRAEVLEWSKKKGRVRIHGEEWKAVSQNNTSFKSGDLVTISSVDRLTLTVTKGD